jgi:hypothetical protein
MKAGIEFEDQQSSVKPSGSNSRRILNNSLNLCNLCCKSGDSCFPARILVVVLENYLERRAGRLG